MSDAAHRRRPLTGLIATVLDRRSLADGAADAMLSFAASGSLTGGLMTQVTREHVRDVLARAHLTPEQERNILALSYPADVEQVIAMFAEYGVTRDWLTDRLGGSP